MKEKVRRLLFFGVTFILLFSIWTLLVQIVDVRQLGVHETDIGFATINCWVHKMIGVHRVFYVITDWLGLIPIFVCMIFGIVGIVQLIKRKSIFRVDYDIIILGIYYIVVIFCYLIFEMISINYRPVLIEGLLEVSYPSSTTLLVLCVMPTLFEQVNRRIVCKGIIKAIKVFTICFSGFMVLGRLFAGVHWLTDIIGSIILSAGLFCIYKAIILICCKREN